MPSRARDRCAAEGLRDQADSTPRPLANTPQRDAEHRSADDTHRLGDDVAIKAELEQERRGEHERDRADPNEDLARENLFERESAGGGC